MTNRWRSLATHAATAFATLGVVAALLGGRLEAQRGAAERQAAAARAANPPPPAPVPALEAQPDEPGQAKARAQALPGAPPLPEDVLKNLDPDERRNVQVYAAVNKSVVNITTEAEVSGFFGDETSTGTGSGFVLDKLGRILTNFHVVQGANAVRVTLFDGSTHDARIIGADASNDVAMMVVKVPPEKLFPVVLGDSSTVLVGQKILALGNPFGLERTLTSGIISSLDRSLKAKNGRMIKGIIQTDAAINPGNSGGPLLNSRGQVIGMNTAIVSNVGQSAGISFAVPINAISRILGQLIENGRVIRADLGVTRVYATGEGLLVMALVEGGPAERAGVMAARVRVERLAPGFVSRSIDPDTADLIVAVDHKRVRTVEELLTEVEKHKPGETIRLTVVRDGKPLDVPVVLGKS